MRAIPRGRTLNNIVYLVFLLAAALVFVLNLSSTQLQSASHGVGRTREVNMQKLQQRIQSNTLSDHKAMFFKGTGETER
jgi:hypothetical protein